MTFVGGTRYNVNAARGGAYQPINYTIVATADSTGAATFLFDAVALSNTWTLTVNAADAPDTARFTALSGATAFGQFKGSNSWGPIQLQGGDRLQISAIGLIPGTIYQVAGYGYCNVVNEPEIIYPVAYADTVTSSTEQIYVGMGQIPTTGLTLTVPIQPSYRSLYVALQGTNGHPASNITVTVVGNSSGFVYSVIPVPYNALAYENVYRIPLLTLNDTTVGLQFTNAGTTAINYWYGADLADVDVAVYPEGEFDVTVETADGVPIDVVNYGGLSIAGLTTTATGTALLLAAPPSGSVYRIQSVSMYYSGSTTPTNGRMLINGSATELLAVFTYPYQNTISLNGQLVGSTIYVDASSTTSTQWTITYDTIVTPTID